MFSKLTKQAERSRQSGFSSERLRSPGDLVARMRPRFSEFGITRLAEITSLDDVGWPVWAAVRPNAPTLSVCQGKGPTSEAAQASAVMEAVEIAVAERVQSTRVTSAAALAAEGALFDLLPAMLRRGCTTPTSQDVIGWVMGHDLTTGDDIWLPVQAVQLDAADPGRRYWQSTDGIGSGNLMVEAVMHGLLERIERDAIEMFQLRSDEEIAASCIDLGGLKSPEVSALARAIADAGLHVRAFAITSDLGIPAVFAIVSPPPNGQEARWRHFDLASGSAARLDMKAATMAAIGEALQSRLTVISGARDDFQPAVYDQRIALDLLVYPRAVPRYVPPAPTDARRPCPLDSVLERLDAMSIGSVIVVPLHEDTDFAVAKLIVPDLELPPGARNTPHGARVQRAAELSP